MSLDHQDKLALIEGRNRVVKDMNSQIEAMQNG